MDAGAAAYHAQSVRSAGVAGTSRDLGAEPLHRRAVLLPQSSERTSPLVAEELRPGHARHAVATVHPAQPVLPLLLQPHHLVDRSVRHPALVAADVLDPPVDLEQVPPDAQVDLGAEPAGLDHELRLGPADV